MHSKHVLGLLLYKYDKTYWQSDKLHSRVVELHAISVYDKLSQVFSYILKFDKYFITIHCV